MISRTSKTYIENLLSTKKDWKILDIGCGYSANNYATTICDVQDLSNFYKDKNFVTLENNDLPFDDNQFDFVISSHVMEHVKDLEYFIKEIERVSIRGYIELPTKLEDNLVFENKKEHLWQMEFDDVNHKLLISKKIQFLEPVLTVSTIQKMHKYFKSSLILELFWENKIEYEFVEVNQDRKDDLNLITLLRKFISKKLRK
ncbi:class I SAM-dependent methyltransferase [Candidatus Pelagibacter sp.]|nr:class I SAM-dependent methyltransferase [Candidatus Pelagibacter sp.]